MVNATKDNPTGCLSDLFAFVMATYSATNQSAGNEMGFYDAEQGQASYLNTLADRFTLSDNFHQSFLAGTGANYFMFGTGDAGLWSDGNGNPVPPPTSLIANPNPKAGTINTYTADNAFTNCSYISQPGVQQMSNTSRACSTPLNRIARKIITICWTIPTRAICRTARSSLRFRTRCPLPGSGPSGTRSTKRT